MSLKNISFVLFVVARATPQRPIKIFWFLISRFFLFYLHNPPILIIFTVKRKWRFFYKFLHLWWLKKKKPRNWHPLLCVSECVYVFSFCEIWMFRQIVAALAIDLGLLGVCLARGILVDDCFARAGRISFHSFVIFRKSIF